MEINIKCSCTKRFENDTIPLVLLLPCNHYIHEMCINKSLLNNINKCTLCSADIKEILTEEKIKISKNKQYYIDFKTVKRENKVIINYSLYPKFIINMNMLINKLMSIKTHENIIETIEFLLKICKIKINILDNTKKNPIIYKNNKIEWINKSDNDKKLVIISNHSNYMDHLVLHHLFQLGFVSSEAINESSIGKIVATKLNLLIFKRGEKPGGNVEKIKEYIEKFKKIIIYPEGMITDNDVMVKFRTGAFNVCDNICPVVIKYKPDVYDPDINKLLLKFLSQDKIEIDVIINDIEKGPFDSVRIEKIRNKMAKIGNLKLSNASNRTIND